MDNKENIWDKFNQLDEVEMEVSASIEILNPENKKSKGMITEEEFNKIFADFL